MVKRLKKKKPRSRAARRGGPALLTPGEADTMRAAGRLAGEILDVVGEHIAVGVTTGEIDRLVDEMTRSRGATSAPYGYKNHGAPPYRGIAAPRSTTWCATASPMTVVRCATAIS